MKSLGSNIRILQFAPRTCWPLDTGAKLRNYHLGRVLSENASITLLSFGDTNQPLGNLESFYETVITVDRDRGYTPSKILRGALGKNPLPVLNYTTPAMKEMLSRVLAESPFDVVQMESIHLFDYLPTITSSPFQPLVVCDWHNIESELMSRYSEREPGLLKRAYARKTSAQLVRLEKAAMRDFDAHLVVSSRDGEQLKRINPEAPTFIIENGVDTSHYSDEQIEAAHEKWARQKPSSGERRRIVFVGSMDYHANVDAAISFAEDVWPLVHESEPELIFTIVGKDPTRGVSSLSTLPGIEVTGSVEDVRPYYCESLAAVVPLRVGGGSRLKILEAMAAGVPVVSTTLGAEGLEVKHNQNILIGDTAQELSEALIRLTENPEVRDQFRIGGRTLVSSKYDWSPIGARLLDIYQDLCSARIADTRGASLSPQTVS